MKHRGGLYSIDTVVHYVYASADVGLQAEGDQRMHSTTVASSS